MTQASSKTANGRIAPRETYVLGQDEKLLADLRENSGSYTEKPTSDAKLWYGEQHSEEENCHKFYSVFVEGTKVIRRFGRCEGYTSYWARPAIEEEHASNEEAIASAKKMILTKRQKGYSTLFEEGFE